MKFSEIIKHTVTLLQESQRITYRALKREFSLDDDALDDLKTELIKAKRLAVDEDGEVLVWVGTQTEGETGKRRNGEKEEAPLGSRTQKTQKPAPSYVEGIKVFHLQPPTPSLQSPVDGERKTITALFADIKGSMNLIEGLDPEDARGLIDPALGFMMEAAQRYGGYVAQSTGDGIFALFGAPVAHEDHPQRALFAALHMQEEARRYAEQLRRTGKPPIEIRVGVNTGEVVVRSIQKDAHNADYVPIGHSTSLAARLQSLAPTGAIVVSDQTYKLTEGYFQFADLGPTVIKGVTEPLTLYQVLGIGPLRTRLQVAARRGLVRFVGRHQELELLQHALEEAKQGHGQIVGVRGEPGVGKSRLFHEFKLRFARGCLVLETFSISHGKAYPYLPLIELLKHYFQFAPNDDERTRRQKVLGKVLELDRTLEDTLPYLFALLDSTETPVALQQMDPRIRRQRTFATIARLLVRESQRQPLLLIVEDLHWLDSETEAFLRLLSEQIMTAPLLLAVNYRPEYALRWDSAAASTEVRLAPFGSTDAEELLTALLGSATELQPIRQFVLTKTDGNPFFTEELVHALVEQGVVTRNAGEIRLGPTSVTQLRLPPTVQGILASRIDRLPPEEKNLLQTLAVIGKEVSLRLLTHVVRTPEAELQQYVIHLQTAEFLYEQPAPPDVAYTFKHALTQEVAYNSLLIERRKTLHLHTARAIEQLYHDRLDTQYGELAHHYSRSEDAVKAVEYLELAGKQAIQQSANAEAITHLTTALDMLATLPASVQRSKQELMLLLTLGSPLRVVKGYAAPEVEKTYTRARALSQQLGDSRLLFSALRGLWGTYAARGEGDKIQAFGDEILGLMRTTQESTLLIEGHHTLVMSRISGGEFVEAYAHSLQGCALYNPLEHHSLVFLYAQDPRIGCMVYGAWSQWFLGYPEQAWQRMREALTLQQQLAHPFSQANFLNVALALHQFSREMGSAPEQAEALDTLATEHGFPLALGMGLFWRGWVLTRQGALAEGLEIMKQAFDSLQDMGYVRMWVSPVLAAAYGEAGRHETGLALLTEALAVADRKRIRIVEAELYRLKGELTLQRGGKEQGAGNAEQESQNPQPPSQIQDPESEAEACFHNAIAVAQRQQAKPLELRAVMSLVRLRQHQAQDTARRNTHDATRTALVEAHHMLSAIYNWFTEGFDTKDLQEAKALLDMLAEGH